MAFLIDHIGRVAGPLTVAATVALLALPAHAGDDSEALGEVEVPLPGNLDEFVDDTDAAVRLGKALFWDTQVGGDGQTACATCHFKAGVDARVINTVNPGPDGLFTIVTGPGETVDAADFPFGSLIIEDDIIGSQGVVRADFVDLPFFGNHVDDCDLVDDGTFFPDRQVTGRQAPNMIMAIFNRENFWDGRANEVFDGTVGNDNDGGIWVDNGTGLEQEAVELEPASQASQEVGPPNNEVEMSCLGRTFPQLGEKLLALGLTPLGQEHVASVAGGDASDDSVLGGIANLGTGLSESYSDMIEAAFNARFWNSLDSVNGHTQKELNFNFFWGIAVMLYGSTLIPDQTPFDLGTMSASATRGQDVFDDAKCDRCHRAPEFTNASIQNGGNGHAFANTGVRPTADDPGKEDGEFKSPTLRNVELSGPYFHNGGQLTLRQVVDFYDRGGDHPNDETDSAIRPLGLSGGEKNDLVDFMLALTDLRVKCEKAPFDRPAIDVSNFGPIAAVGAAGLDPGNDVNCLEPFLDADHHAE